MPTVVDPDPDKQVVRVRVLYADRAYQDPDWAELPGDGVLIVVLYYADGTRRIMQATDWYFRAPGPADWIYGHTDNPADIDRYEGAVRLRGRWTDDATYAAVERDALEGD